jgi:hypothetical protein
MRRIVSNRGQRGQTGIERELTALESAKKLRNAFETFSPETLRMVVRIDAGTFKVIRDTIQKAFDMDAGTGR